LKRAALFAISVGLLSLCLCPPASLAKRPHAPNPIVAETWLRYKLVNRGLTPATVHCRVSGLAVDCHWTATSLIDQWPFHCEGRARRTTQGSRVERCRPLGPPLAPVHSVESLGGWQPSFGFNEDWISQLPHLDLAAAMGSDTARIPFDWNIVESQRNHYNWGPYDRVYAAMVSRGITPLLAISNSPCWARPKTPCTGDAAWPPGKQFLKQWSEFVQLAVRRYPQLIGIEVWNEPNLTGFWRPKPNPKRYVGLLKAAHRAVRKVRRGLPLVFGGLVPQFGPAARGMDSRIFQRRAYKKGAGRYVDAFGVHPYVFPSNDPNLIDSVRAQMAIPKGIAARYGYPETPLWVTEFGLSTMGVGALSPPDQATRLVSLYQLLRGIPDVPVLILHRLLDTAAYDPDWLAGMGVTNYKGDLKPSFCALAKARRGFCPY
jgi:hypothetical protein